jgi:hypothetical protein
MVDHAEHLRQPAAGNLARRLMQRQTQALPELDRWLPRAIRPWRDTDRLRGR